VSEPAGGNDDEFPPLTPQLARWKQWAIALSGGGVILAAIALLSVLASSPTTYFSARDRDEESAAPALRAILGAEDVYFETHHGSLIEFDSAGPSQPAWQVLQLPPMTVHHTFSATKREGVLWIVARGDAGLPNDDWQVSSTDRDPLHVYDGARNVWNDSALYALLGSTPPGEDLTIDVRAQLRSGIRAYHAARAAQVVLQDLASGEAAYQRAHGGWLAFDALTPEVWNVLGQTTSGALAYNFRATIDGSGLRLTAAGNLDADPCIDQWEQRPGGAPVHLEDDVHDVTCPLVLDTASGVASPP
jgi:hypothetical protein